MKVTVMARVPTPGHAKTRLIPTLGAERAAALCRAMAEDVFDIVAASGLPWRVALLGDVSQPWVDPWEPQAEGDLGAKLRHALREGGIAIGTDSPTLPASLLKEAAAAPTDVAFAPAFDGGYTLVMVRNPAHLGVFDGIPWSCAETLAASVERARSLGLSVTLLPFWYDVDTASDLAFLRTHLRALPPTVAPRTRALLQESLHAPAHR